MWGESGAGRSPQCGAGRAQPMGSVDGGARGGGAGAGRYFRGGRASAVLSGRAERSSEAPARSRRAGRRARGGARAAGEARRADGGSERSARGRGTRRPRRRRLLLQEEPRGHRPCPRPASGHPCSPGAPRGLACVKVSGGWGRPRGGGPRPSRAAPRAGPSPEAWSRAGLGMTPSAPLLPAAAPPCALATLGRGWRPRAAEVRLPASSPHPPSGVSLRCVEASGVWGRGRGGGEGSGVTRRLLPPPPSGASFLQRGRPVTPALLQAGRGRAADRPGGGWGEDAFSCPRCWPLGAAALWRMAWWRDKPGDLKGGNTSICVCWWLGGGGSSSFGDLAFPIAKPGIGDGELSWSALFAFPRSPLLLTEAAGLGPCGRLSVRRPRSLAFFPQEGGG